MALSTANAADLYGSLAGVKYSTTSDTSTEEAFATDISTATFSTWAGRSTYNNDFQPHIDTVVAANGGNGATWQLFKGVYNNDADFIGVYVAAAAVSPDFKT